MKIQKKIQQNMKKHILEINEVGKGAHPRLEMTHLSLSHLIKKKNQDLWTMWIFCRF